MPVGIFGGGVFGLIRSTEHNLRRLEELGPDFKLGRIAINEINEYRLDSNYIRKWINNFFIYICYIYLKWGNNILQYGMMRYKINITKLTTKQAQFNNVTQMVNI